MEKDLTVIYITASEIKESFAQYQRSILHEAIGDTPMIVITRSQATLFRCPHLVDQQPKSLSNIYFQILRACHYADTEFVAIAEDDCLYHKDHFKFRPKPDEFLYDQNRFALFTWGEPIYSWRNRKSNCSLIAPRKLLIEALEERFAKWPNGTPDKITGEVGRGMVERNLGITVRKSVEVFGEVSIIQVNHENASEDRQRSHRKKLGQIKAYDLYHWGHAKNIREIYDKSN